MSVEEEIRLTKKGREILNLKDSMATLYEQENGPQLVRDRLAELEVLPDIIGNVLLTLELQSALRKNDPDCRAFIVPVNIFNRG